MPDSLKGLAGLQTEMNSTHVGEWPHWIGQFMINFCGIEGISHQYLNRLERDREAYNRNLKKDLSLRVARVRKLIKANRSLDPVVAEYVNQLWLVVDKNLKWRNRIAHNPITMSWKPGSNPDRDPPDELGIINMRELQKGDESTSLSLDQLKELVRWSAEIAHELNRLAANLGSISDKQ